MAKDDVKLVGPAGYVMMPKAKERTLLASGHYRTPADFLKAQTEANAKTGKGKAKPADEPAGEPAALPMEE